MFKKFDLDSRTRDDLRDRLTLEDGKIVILEAFEQRYTYADLWIGSPDKRVNDSLIERAIEVARMYCEDDDEPFLVSPERISQPDATDKEYLPNVRCVARFNKVVDEADLDFAYYSVLVWFQDQFGSQFDDSVGSLFKDISWNKCRRAIPLEGE